MGSAAAQREGVAGNTAPALHVARQLQKAHESGQILAAQLNGKARHQEGLIKTPTLKAGYTEKTAGALRNLAAKQKGRIKQHQEGAQTLRRIARKYDRAFDAEELLSSIKPYEEMVAGATAPKKSPLPTDVTGQEFLKAASRPSSPKPNPSKGDNAATARTQTETPPQGGKGVIGVGSPPEGMLIARINLAPNSQLTSGAGMVIHCRSQQKVVGARVPNSGWKKIPPLHFRMALNTPLNQAARLAKALHSWQDTMFPPGGSVAYSRARWRSKMAKR